MESETLEYKKSKSFKQKLKSLWGLFNEKYPAYKIEGILNEYFEETRLSQLVKPCLITAYDIENRDEVFFNTTDIKKNGNDYLIKDIARATSAAPTYFEVANIKDIKGYSTSLIDGGVFANNPSMCALVEITKFKPVPRLDEIFILSIGTGKDVKNEKKYSYKKAKNWGLGSWVKPLIDIMMSANSETVNYQLKKIFANTGSSKHFFRLQTELIKADPSMDNATDQNIKALVEDAEFFISKNKQKLDKIAELLIL